MAFDTFKPLPFMSGAHRQTLAGWAAPAPVVPHGTLVEKVSLDEGNATTTHYHEPTEARADSPTVVLIHGLEGDADRSYMIRFARKAAERGFRTARMNMRWCGDAEGLSSTFYNSTQSEDIQRVCEHLQSRNPSSRVGVLGFSLGGNMALKMAAENRFPSLGAIAALCPPIDLQAAAGAIVRYGNGWYHRYLIKSMVDRGNRFLEENSIRLQADLTYRMTIMEFDRQFTVPLGRFESLDDYYEKGSSMRLLPRIQCPSMIIASQDDPLIPFESFAGVDGGIRLLAPEAGGHLGFIGTPPPGDPDRYWAENRAMDFFLEILGE